MSCSQWFVSTLLWTRKRFWCVSYLQFISSFLVVLKVSWILGCLLQDAYKLISSKKRVMQCPSWHKYQNHISALQGPYYAVYFQVIRATNGTAKTSRMSFIVKCRLGKLRLLQSYYKFSSEKLHTGLLLSLSANRPFFPMWCTSSFHG